MRAERLLSLLMLLQTRGSLTAQEMARELEVSARTIYRDVEALSQAGFPIYGEAGPGGGYALLDSYRTQLTGLSSEEVQALFMLSIPAPLAELGVSQDLKAAMLKLSASLSDTHRLGERHVRQRFHLDAVGWHHGESAVPHLHTVYRAVWEDLRLWISYTLPPLSMERELLVEPYSLVAKAGVWYLLYAYGDVELLRVRRIASLLSARLSTETFRRDPQFDLAVYWEAWCAQREREQHGYVVRLRISPALSAGHHFGERGRVALAEAPPPDEEGWHTLSLTFESLEAARGQLLALGGAVEVLAPKALRWSMADYAEQIASHYV